MARLKEIAPDLHGLVDINNMRLDEALGAPMSPAWVQAILHVEGSTLPKSVESGKLSLDKGRHPVDVG